jgi:Predicted methyltransferase regulatory domain
MKNWADGYPLGIEYTHGYQAELNPLRLQLAFLNVGMAAPQVTTACELGFGQGESMNLHAAASTTQWFGTDLCVVHAAHAREAAAASGAAAKFFDESFADFCRRSDLPDFDFIGLHGVWSWVSDENRRTIVDFVNRKLRDGGVLYASYNTLPGHAAFLPVQDLLTRSVDLQRVAGREFVSAMNAALEFTQKVVAASPRYAQANPQVVNRLSGLMGVTGVRPSSEYIAHEYVNREWSPMSFSRVAEWLAPARLDYACSARYFDMVDGWNLTPDQQALMKEIPDLETRETVRDFMVNQWFRKDYWTKGARRLTLPELAEGFRRLRVIQAAPRSGMSLEAIGALGKFVPPGSVSVPIFETLADGLPKTLRQIEHAVRDRGVELPKIINFVLTLVETGALAVVQEEAVAEAARRQTDRFNAYVCDRACRRVSASVLASPVIGTGLIDVGRVVQYFWLGVSQGRKRPAELAAHAAQIFRSEGMTILADEKRFVPADGSLAPLISEATFFLENVMPLLRALQIL